MKPYVSDLIVFAQSYPHELFTKLPENSEIIAFIGKHPYCYGWCYDFSYSSQSRGVIC